MSEKTRGKFVGKNFGDKELSRAAGLVREAMLRALPEPAMCDHQFSPEFQTKMERLFAKDRVYHTLHTIHRYAAAIILLILFTAGVVLAVDTEARANFFEWVKKIYENSIVYEFFGGVQEDGLPTYELGWVPEDNRGHGTMVAGVIGAVGNNGTGVTGTCWNVNWYL